MIKNDNVLRALFKQVSHYTLLELKQITGNYENIALSHFFIAYFFTTTFLTCS